MSEPCIFTNYCFKSQSKPDLQSDISFGTRNSPWLCHCKHRPPSHLWLLMRRQFRPTSSFISIQFEAHLAFSSTNLYQVISCNLSLLKGQNWTFCTHDVLSLQMVMGSEFLPEPSNFLYHYYFSKSHWTWGAGVHRWSKWLERAWLYPNKINSYVFINFYRINITFRGHFSCVI